VVDFNGRRKIALIVHPSIVQPSSGCLGERHCLGSDQCLARREEKEYNLSYPWSMRCFQTSGPTDGIHGKGVCPGTTKRKIVCFSATANFVGSGVLGSVGVVTLTKVKHRRELLFASLPTLFAIHQFIEGFVWLGLDGIFSPAVAHDMGAAFMLYAQGLLPFLLPMSVVLFEPDRKSRRRMLPFLVLGGATTLYILWALTAFPLQLYVTQHSIVYINQATNNSAVAVVYVIATCGTLFFSKIKMMVVFGAANLAILLAVMVYRRYAFTSLWCAYAAVASIIILAYFWRSHEARPFLYA